MSINRNTKVFAKNEVLVDTTSDFFLLVRGDVVVEGVTLEMGDCVIIASFYQEKVEFFTYLVSEELYETNWAANLVDNESCQLETSIKIPLFEDNEYEVIYLRGVVFLEEKIKKYYHELKAFELKAFFGDGGTDMHGPERKVQGNMVCYSSGRCTELVNERNLALESDWYDGSDDTVSIFKNKLIATEQENGQVIYELVVSVDCAADVYTTAYVTEEFLQKWYPQEDIPAKIKTGLSNQSHLFTN